MSVFYDRDIMYSNVLLGHKTKGGRSMAEYKELRQKLKEIFKQTKHYLNEKQIKELNALNFYYEEAGGSGHPKLVYIQNGKSLVFAISSTPSDKRGYLNWISKVIHTIAENPND